MPSFFIPTGTTQTSRITMGGADDLTVAAGGTLSVSSNAQAVRFTTPTNGAIITNQGVIEVTGSQEEPRAIRFESGIGSNLNATIINSGLVRGINDAVQIQASAGVVSGLLSITNTSAAQITSAVGQALDLAGVGGTFEIAVVNVGVITAQIADSIQLGATASVVNQGLIDGGTSAAYTGADGVQFEDNADGQVENYGSGVISGDRHGINGGVGSYVAVINGVSGDTAATGPVISGRNGSGVGLDGDGEVLNFGVIRGSFGNFAGSDINGPGGVPDGIPDGDGDGIDIDGLAHIDNYGLIEGTGAGGHGSDGHPNTSEGIAAGGGTIINRLGGVIQGAGLGILIDDSSQGNAPHWTQIINSGTIQGAASYAIRILSNLDDAVFNDGAIAGGGGIAILFGTGNNTLAVGDNSVITGLSDGGDGRDALDLSARTAGAAVDLAAGTADGTGGIANFEIVFGTAFGDDIFGDAADNQFFGGLGDDTLNGREGNDSLYGGDGADTLIGGGGIDYARYDDADYGNLVISLANPSINTGAAAGDTFDSIEGIIAGAGNDILYGDDGDNYLYGLGGTDVFFGGLGADRFHGGEGIDYVRYDDADYGDLVISLANPSQNTGAAAGDTFIQIEGLIGGAGNDRIGGNAFVNYLYGGAGNDILAGNFGNDLLNGGAGQDAFVFNTALDPVSNVDRITDFNVADDTIWLARAVFSAIPSLGTLPSGRFHIGADATDANHRIVYDQSTGALFYDADGSGAGAALKFAQLSAGLAMTAADFLII